MRAVDLINENSQTPLILICEHASAFIPDHLNNLGLDADALSSHVAWDIGALDLAKNLANTLDAPLVAAGVSRLVYDCNRPPEAIDAMPLKSEIYDIHGNQNITAEDRNWRINSLYHPFHDAIAKQIQQTLDQGIVPLIVTIHSFTPIYHGNPRRVEIGILHDRDTRLADAMLAENYPYVVERNEPYSPTDGVTHTLQKHAIAQGLPNVMLEIRNDLLSAPQELNKMSETLGEVLQEIIKTHKTTPTFGRVTLD